MNINIDNLNINYIADGNDKGEKILLLHGWGANITLFNNLIELLKPKYKVFALDMPGFGKSDEPTSPWCVSDYVEFVLKFMKIMKIDSCHLLGHSFGGRVIIKAVTRKNLSFTPLNIILVDSAGILPKKSFKQKLKTRIYKSFKWVLSLSLVKKAFPDALENLRKKNGSADYNAASPMMRQTLVKVVNEDLTPLLSEIKQNTLLIWGENDTATPLSDGQLMEKLIKNSGLVTLKNAGHYSFLEQQFIFNKVISSFMKLEE